jgi:hypothetical protein
MSKAIDNVQPPLTLHSFVCLHPGQARRSSGNHRLGHSYRRRISAEAGLVFEGTRKPLTL